MTKVAAANPHAWFPVERTADGAVDADAPTTGWSPTRTRSC